MGKDKLMPAVRRLTGITWNHTRGYLPLVATAQRFSEMHPEVEIVRQALNQLGASDQVAASA